MKRVHVRYVLEGFIDVPDADYNAAPVEQGDLCDMGDMPNWFDPSDVSSSNIYDIAIDRIEDARRNR